MHARKYERGVRFERSPPFLLQTAPLMARMFADDWTARARGELARLLGEGPAWSYRPGGEASVEPTVLAVLGLLSVTSDDESLAVARKATAWLAGLQQADGSLGISATNQEPRWPTSYALLAFQTVGGHPAERKKALDWLLASEGKKVDKDPNIGHDSSLIGWPWVAGTHSWIEPTAVAMLALAGEAERLLQQVLVGETPLAERFREALRLIRNRALPSGGWNYGNTVVLGAETRPQPAPTGMSLAALASVRPAKDSPGPINKEEELRVERACAYLEKLLPKVRSPLSLCWGLLGLSAWDRRPREADTWLAEAAQKSSAWSDPAVQWSLLLLAAGPRTLEFLNVTPKKAEAGKTGS